MNYGRVRQALKAKQEQLKKMAPKDRVLLEEKIIAEANQEPESAHEADEQPAPAPAKQHQGNKHNRR